MANLYSSKNDWSKPSTIQTTRWSYVISSSIEDMSDFTCYLLHRSMVDHPALITAPDRVFPDAPIKAAKMFAELERRLARWLPIPPPLTEQDHKNLVAAAELAALPDDHWHESGRWIVTPRADTVWDRVKKSMVAEAEASDATSAADKKRVARDAKRFEALREKQLRKLEKGLEPR